ncbi:MAG: YqhA family protein [Candidatus Limnocylindrales bacterium]
MSDHDTHPSPSHTDRDPTADHPVRRLLGWSRLLVLLAVVGSFISSATLMVYGVVRAIGIVISLTSHLGDSLATSEKYGKDLIADTIAIVDMFLMGTVMFIVAAGLYQLFVDPRTSLPGWLRIRSLDDLKSLLTGVIIVALLVTFLGAAVGWPSDTGPPAIDILFFGLAIGAVVLAANLSLRIFGGHAAAHDGHDRPTA